VFYRIASPEMIDVLRSVEALLEVTGEAVDLCPDYRI